MTSLPTRCFSVNSEWGVLFITVDISQELSLSICIAIFLPYLVLYVTMSVINPMPHHLAVRQREVAKAPGRMIAGVLLLAGEHHRATVAQEIVALVRGFLTGLDESSKPVSSTRPRRRCRSI
jgi:hypothetical protein